MEQICYLTTFELFRGFPGGSAGKESTCNEGDLGLIPGLGRSPGEEKGYPLQYSGLENSMDCIVCGFAELDTTEWLSLFTCALKHVLDSVGKEATCKAGDTDSIPGVGKTPWRRNWQPTPVFLPGESRGQRSLADYLSIALDKAEWLTINKKTISQPSLWLRLPSRKYPVE